MVGGCNAHLHKANSMSDMKFGKVGQPFFKPRLRKGIARLFPGRRRRFTCMAGTRGYVLHLPAGRMQAPTGLIVMLHGCGQSPEDFAKGTGMNGLADSHGFAVLYPAQSRRANIQGCWRWYDEKHQQADSGEPAIIAAMTRQIITDHAIPPSHVFVAGLSAGAAMSVVMGQTYGDLFAAVGAHAGLPFKAAQDASGAFAAMGGAAQVHGPDRPKRTITFHGTADKTVHLSNSVAIARAQVQPDGAHRISEVIDIARHTAKRDVSFDADRRPVLENWTVAGLGHTWSGGTPDGSYTDADGPDASAAIVRFFFDGPDPSLR